MDHAHEAQPMTEAATAPEATPAQRAHWNQWVWFTSMTKKGIVVVAIITIIARAVYYALNYETISLSAKKKAISVCAFSKLSEPCTEFASIDSANSLRIVPLGGVGRVGGAHDIAVGLHGIFTFQNLQYHRAGNHEIDQVAEKRPGGMHAIKLLRLRLA